MQKQNLMRNIAPPKINLSQRPGEPPLLVDMQRFFEFSFWLAEELLDLEARFGDNKHQLVRK